MEVKPEPLLEMTADERVFIRNHMKCCFLNDATKMLLDILLRVEAGRRWARFHLQHHRPEEYGYKCVVCQYPDSEAEQAPRHNWTPADWLAEVEREVGKERC